MILALAFGGHGAIVRLLNAVLLKPAPGVPNYEQLFWISSTDSLGRPNTLSLREYRELNEGLTSFANLASYTHARPTLVQNARRRLISAELVSSNYFDALKLPIYRGRAFSAVEYAPGAGGLVAVISERLWRDYMDADPLATGKSVRINEHFFTIVGVAPPGFHGLEAVNPADLWIPPSAHGHVAPAHDSPLNQRVFGRLYTGATRSSVDRMAEMIGARNLLSWWGRDGLPGITVSDIRGGVHPSDYAYTTTLAAPAFILSVILLALVTANVVLLVLTRIVSLRHDWAVRLALGGGVLQVSRPLVKELILVFAAGVGGALIVSGQLAPLVMRTTGSDFPVDLGLDAVALAELVGLAIASVACCVWAGVYRASRVSVLSILKEGEAGTATAPRSARLQTGLVVCQFALAVVLVAGALTIASRLFSASRVRSAVSNAANMLAIHIDRNSGPLHRLDEALNTIQKFPGVTGAALTAVIPLSGNYIGMAVSRPGGSTSRVSVRVNVVSPGYFDLLELPIIAGRDFNNSDNADAPGVVIVDEVLAKSELLHGEALGQHIRFGTGNSSLMRVVGVVRAPPPGQMGQADLPSIYLSQAQNRDHFMTILARVSTHTTGLRAAISRHVESSTGLLRGSTTVRSLADYAREQNAGVRTASWLALFAALLGVFLSASALYGAVAYDIAYRRREIGIRRALGAGLGDIVRVAIGKPLRIAVLGSAIGFLLLLVMVVISPRLFDIGALTAAALPVTIVLGLTAACAVAVPTYHAVSVNPADALR